MQHNEYWEVAKEGVLQEEKGQTKRSSLIEAVVNTLIGFGTTLIMAPVIFWSTGVTATFTQMGVQTVLFTILSIARNYIIRRWFNKKKNI